MEVLLANKYGYIKGGADTVFFNTKRLLEEHGNKVIPFCVKNDRNDPSLSEYSDYFAESPEIRNQNFFGKVKEVSNFFYNKGAARQLGKLLERERPDIAHLHNIFNGLSMSILPVLKKYRIPVIITLHDARFICPSSYCTLRGKKCEQCLKRFGLNCGIYRCFHDEFINSWMCAFEMFQKERLFHYDDYIEQYIFVSKFYKDLHAEKHDYFGRKGTVLYNFYKQVEAKETKHEDYFLYYGRIISSKGIGTLIQAVKELPNVKLRIAGTGDMLDDIKRMKLKNVECLGFIKGEELKDAIKNASFIIVPSEWIENNPMTIIEAYSYGKPVIGSRIGGIPEIINEGNTGYVFNAFDKTDLMKKLIKASKISDEEYTRMSSAAYQFARHNFSDAIHYEKLMNIYNQAIDNYENI